MNMFNDLIVSVDKEILNLKEYKRKSTQTLETQDTEVTLSFDLELRNEFGYEYARSTNMALVAIDTGANIPLIGVKFDIIDLNSRNIRRVGTYDAENDAIGEMVYVFSYNENDLNTLRNGGSVTVSYKMILSSTSPIKTSVSYDDLWTD